MNTSLTTEQRQALQDALLARRAALDVQSRAHLAGQSRASHAREVLLQDGDDAPQRDADRELDFDRTDRDATALLDVDRALQRLAQGSYGSCTDCSEPIDLARLQASPEVSRCLACETRHERGRPRSATL
jgi:DnaK suppressor protein